MRGTVKVAVGAMSEGGTSVSFDGRKVANGMNALETITFPLSPNAVRCGLPFLGCVPTLRQNIER